MRWEPHVSCLRRVQLGFCHAVDSEHCCNISLSSVVPVSEMPVSTPGNGGPCLLNPHWDLASANSFGTFRATDASLNLPWEQGVMRQIFGNGDLFQPLLAIQLAEASPSVPNLSQLTLLLSSLRNETKVPVI